MNNVHPIFARLLDSVNPTIPTNQGDKTILEIVDHLTYASYRHNRDEGCSHEGLVRIGVGNEKMKERYEWERLAKGN